MRFFFFYGNLVLGPEGKKCSDTFVSVTCEALHKTLGDRLFQEIDAVVSVCCAEEGVVSLWLWRALTDDLSYLEGPGGI